MLPNLLNQTPSKQGIDSMTAGGVYDSLMFHGAISARDAHAGIPQLDNAQS